MANLEKTVKILFQGDDQVGKTITGLSGKFSDFGGTLESVADPFASIADGILKLDAALAALTAGGLAYAYIKSMEFETASVNLAKILGAEKDKIGEVEQATIALSNQYGEASVSVLDSATNFKKAGFSVEESLLLSEKSIQLVMAASEAEFGVAEASAAITTALKGFHAPAAESTRLIDILNGVANEYATNVTQLSKGMSQLAPVARLMGFSMEEAAGLLTPIIEVFQSGEEAAVALKMGLTRMVSDQKPVQAALKALGVEQKDLNGNFRSGKDIFMDVAKAFQGMDKNAKLYYLTELVGVRQVARLSEVFNNLDKVLEITGKAYQATGSVFLEVTEKLKTAEVQVNRFKTGFSNLAIAIGDGFKVATTEAVVGGTAIETALEQMVRDGTFDPILKRIESFADEVGDILTSVAENLPNAMRNVDIDGLMDAFDDLKHAFGGLFSEINLSTSKGLADAIQSVVDAIESVMRVSTGMVKAFVPFVESIKGAIESFNELDVDAKESFGEIILLAKAIVELGPKMALAMVAISDGADKLAPAFKVTIDTISGFFDGVVLIWNGLKLAVIEIVDDLLAASQLIPSVLLPESVEQSIVANRTILNQWRDDTKEAMRSTADSAVKHLTGIETNFNGMTTGAKGATEEVKKLPIAIREIPDDKESKITIDGTEYGIEQAKLLKDLLTTFPRIKKTEIKTEVDKPALEKVIGVLKTQLDDGSWKLQFIKAKADQSSTEKAASEIQKELDPLKVLEIEAKFDIAKLETMSSMFGNAMSVLNTEIEWDAKFDIAQVEADAKKVEAAFDSIGGSVVAVTNTVGDMFSGLTDTGSYEFSQLFPILQKEQGLQGKLIASQIKLIDAQAAAMKKGDAIFSLNGENLSDGAKGFMMAILKDIQVEMQGASSAFLMGTST